jgi:hypothetical protein
VIAVGVWVSRYRAKSDQHLFAHSPTALLVREVWVLTPRLAPPSVMPEQVVGILLGSFAKLSEAL